jgi:MFS family permease
MAADIGAAVSEAAPLLETARSEDSSPAGLKESGSGLQAILEGAVRRRTSDLGVIPAAPSQEVSPSGLTPSAETAAGPETADKAPVPQPEDGLPPQAKSNFRSYAFGVSAVKTGLDALNLAVPLILLDTFHAAMAVSALYLAAELARLVSGTLGGAVIDHIGAGRALTLTIAVQIAATASLPFILIYGGAWAMPMVFAAFIVNGVGYELFDVARRAALPQIVGRDEGVLRAQNGRLYVWREIAATAGVFGAGWVVKTFGTLNTIWIHPAFCFLAALAVLRLWHLKPQAGPGKPVVRQRITFAAWWADLRDGMRRVFQDPKLRSLVLINIPLTAVHKLFHTVVSVVFAAQVLHDPTFAAIMVGAWNLGELAGSFYLDRRGKDSHFSNWLRLAAAASLSMWTFYLLPVAWAAMAASFLIAAAMIGNELGTASYMQSTVPEEHLGSVTGFVYGLSRSVGMLALLGAGWAFDALTPAGGFLVLALIFTVMAPIYLVAAQRFKSDRVAPPADMPED